MRIILASQSPRRKKLLQQLGFSFDVIPSTVDEFSTTKDPVQLVEELAYRKAKDVANRNADSLIIGADTIVVKDKQILGKPKDRMEASKTLNILSNTQHSVYTGVAIVSTDKNLNVLKSSNFSVLTNVYFSKLEQNEIEAYIDTGSPMDKAGSYGIQDDWGAAFVEKIEGDFYNVIGLPLNKLYNELKLNFPEILKN